MQRGKGRPFVKGQAPGRPKGIPNKFTSTVKDTVLKVFNILQDDPKHNLEMFAKKYPREFYTLAGRLIPAEMVAKVDTDVIVRFIRDEGNSDQS